MLSKTWIAVVLLGAASMPPGALAEECFTREVNGSTFTNCVDGKPIQAHGVEVDQVEVLKAQGGDKLQLPAAQRTFEFKPVNAGDVRPGLAGSKSPAGKGKQAD